MSSSGEDQGGVQPEVWNPYPYLRIFLSRKMADLADSPPPQIFENLGPISKGFLPQKWLILQFFFHNFCEMGPSSKDFFWPKWNLCLRIFCEKVTHLGSTSRYALTCEYPLPPPPPGLILLNDITVRSCEDYLHANWSKG